MVYVGNGTTLKRLPGGFEKISTRQKGVVHLYKHPSLEAYRRDFVSSCHAFRDVAAYFGWSVSDSDVGNILNTIFRMEVGHDLGRLSASSLNSVNDDYNTKGDVQLAVGPFQIKGDLFETFTRDMPAGLRLSTWHKHCYAYMMHKVDRDFFKTIQKEDLIIPSVHYLAHNTAPDLWHSCLKKDGKTITNHVLVSNLNRFIDMGVK